MLRSSKILDPYVLLNPEGGGGYHQAQDSLFDNGIIQSHDFWTKHHVCAALALCCGTQVQSGCTLYTIL